MFTNNLLLFHILFVIRKLTTVKRTIDIDLYKNESVNLIQHVILVLNGFELVSFLQPLRYVRLQTL